MKKILLAAVAMVLTSTVVLAAEITPVKLSIVPVLSIPSAQTVHGLDFAILGSNPEEVQGLQLSWIYAGTSRKMVGVQNAFVSIGEEVTGVQLGFYNSAQNMKGIQWGFINVAGTIKGVQIGLVNIVKKNGILPFMVFINGGF